MALSRICLSVLSIGGLLSGLPALAGDWRLDLLKEHGVGEGRENWMRFLKSGAGEGTEWEAVFQKLGSEVFQEREEAQRQLAAAGVEAAEWLRTKERDEDPEVRIRVRDILKTLESSDAVSERSFLRHAARSLVEHGEMPDTGGTFYEWFGEGRNDVAKGYRSFVYEGPAGKLAKVEGRQLVFAGNRPGDFDQRMILRSSVWPGMPTFPDHFTASASLGGSEGGAGAFHLGITVGQVRALFHPGYRGGGFRFEKIGVAKALTANKDMGFTPSHDRMQKMILKVDRTKEVSWRMEVTVESEDGVAFKDQIVLSADDLGVLRTISLDRSGRTGGDARFGNFSVVIRPE